MLQKKPAWVSTPTTEKAITNLIFWWCSNNWPQDIGIRPSGVSPVASERLQTALPSAPESSVQAMTLPMLSQRFSGRQLLCWLYRGTEGKEGGSVTKRDSLLYIFESDHQNVLFWCCGCFLWGHLKNGCRRRMKFLMISLVQKQQVKRKR